jgi:cell division protein FtsL
VSLPARAVPRSAPRGARRTAAPPSPRGGAPERRRRTASRPDASPAGQRAESPTGLAPPRRRHHVGFVIFACCVVGLMVVGLVGVNALLAQSSFRVHRLELIIQRRSDRNREMTEQAARLSAPQRIAEWARRHGMRLPRAGQLHVLRVAATAAPVAAATSSALDRRRASPKPIVDGAG